MKFIPSWVARYRLMSVDDQAKVLISLIERGRWDLYFELSANNRHS